MYEKQDLFSNDLDSVGFKHQSIMCIQGIDIV